jgi:hypothetical protein
LVLDDDHVPPVFPFEVKVEVLPTHIEVVPEIVPLKGGETIVGVKVCEQVNP